MINTSPFAALKHRTIAGKTMAYIDEGEGDAIVFQHGNPTSSYLWRNVMPHLAGLGRLVACDLIGMGGSDKLSPSGPERYHYAERRDYLFALWDELDLGGRVVLVLHDWGSALGFDWANQHRDRVQGIAYMEALATPLQWSDVSPEKQPTFRDLRSPAGDDLILEQNAFVEAVLPGSVPRGLSAAEMNHYRRPFRDAGEDRRPTLSWPRDLPIGGEPADVVAVVEGYNSWLAESDVPKLFINAEPGAIINDRVRAHVRTWRNQTETTVAGIHYIQEDSPGQIGSAVADFVRRLRAL
jgi:haloalkane dehalogenase